MTIHNVITISAYERLNIISENPEIIVLNETHTILIINWLNDIAHLPKIVKNFVGITGILKPKIQHKHTQLQITTARSDWSYDSLFLSRWLPRYILHNLDHLINYTKSTTI